MYVLPLTVFWLINLCVTPVPGVAFTVPATIQTLSTAAEAHTEAARTCDHTLPLQRAPEWCATSWT
jgi:hypothetical protein